MTPSTDPDERSYRIRLHPWVRTPKRTAHLLDWPRTGDEDVHESPGALLPVRAGRHMGDADQCAEQIEWLQISTNVAALDGALHQRINRSLDLTARTFIQLRRATDERVQCRRDDLLGCDVIHEQEHPGSQRFNRRHGVGEFPLRCRYLIYFGPIDRFDQCVSRRKVAIQSSCSDT